MLGLRTTIYKVPDLKAAKEWYTRAFSQEAYFDEPFYIGFNIGGYELGLLPSNKKVSPSSNVLSYWGVENIEETYQHLLSIGAVTHEAPNNVGGDIQVASVWDPWGNLIGIIYNPHFSLV